MLIVTSHVLFYLVKLLKAVMQFPHHCNKISVPCGYYSAEYSGFIPG